MTSLERYLQLREAQRRLGTKLFRFLAESEQRGDRLVLRAARELGFPVRARTVVFDKEADMDRFYDYLLYERFDSRGSICQKYLESNPTLPSDEMIVLRALAETRTSLWEVVSAKRHEGAVLLRELVADERELTIYDINYASNVPSGTLYFARILTAEGISFCSGAALYVSAPQQGVHPQEARVNREAQESGIEVQEALSVLRPALPSIRHKDQVLLIDSFTKGSGLYSFTFSRMLATAFSTSSECPKALSRKKPSPLGPKPEPGVPTTWASLSSLSKNSQEVMPAGVLTHT